MIVVTTSLSKSSVFVTDSSVDGRPNRRNKAAFLNFCGVMWTLPDMSHRCWLIIAINFEIKY